MRNLRALCLVGGNRAGAEAVDAAARPISAGGRRLRASEPRDLIERVRDICKLRAPVRVDAPLLDLAWTGYLGGGVGGG